VGNSGRQQEICALKILRERNGRDFPSRDLELVALEHERFGHVAHNVLASAIYCESVLQMVVRDPANRDNLISDDLSAADKKAIAQAARGAVYDENWKKMNW
jgi:hypothetical protein